MQTELLKVRIAKIVAELHILQTKIDIYSERDWLAAGVYRTKYMELDMECLDLMTELQTLETPPDHAQLGE